MKNILMNPLTYTALFIALLILIIFYIKIFIKRFKDKTTPFKTKIRQNIVRLMMFVFMILIMINLGKRVYKYYTFDIHFSKDNTRYTLANLDYVWQDFRGRFYTVAYYTGEFSFSIDGVKKIVKSEVPENFTNYTYFVKINTKNTKYYEILKTKYILPTNYTIPEGGWIENPIYKIGEGINIK